MSFSDVSKTAVSTPALGWQNIPLPSRGVLYGEKLPGGIVQMRKMMSTEMSRLQSQGGTYLDRIEAVVNACTKFPTGFNSSELLLTDSFFLMLALRTMTFGPKYAFTYRCRYCGSKQKSTVDIVEDLDEKPAEETLREPIEIELVDAACKISIRLMRLADRDLIAKHVKRTKLTTLDADDPSYHYRMALSLVDRNGDPFTDFLKRQDFIRGLTAMDCLRIEQETNKHEPGVETKIMPDCTACGTTNEMGLPFDAEFFRPGSV